MYLTNREGSPLSAWTGKATEKDWPKRSSDRQLQEAQKKTDRAITLTAEAVHVPAHLVPPGFPEAKQLCHLHAQPSLGQSYHRQKKPCVYAQRVTLVVFVLFVALQTVACQASLSGRGFSRQEYWCILASTGFHTLLEHYSFCCPSHQLPWAPGAARTPATQAVAPSLHLALTGANPSPPGQPQEQTPLSNPHIEVERKSQLKPRGSVDEEEDPKPFPQLYKLAD